MFINYNQSSFWRSVISVGNLLPYPPPSTWSVDSAEGVGMYVCIRNQEAEISCEKYAVIFQDINTLSPLCPCPCSCPASLVQELRDKQFEVPPVGM